MATSSILPTSGATTVPTVTAATTTPTTSSTSSSASSPSDVASNEIAGNFQTFLTLLTTQLQNQDPMSPLDTNQFTQQLVEFASAERQRKPTTNLQHLGSR